MAVAMKRRSVNTLEEFIEHFWARVDVRGPAECWEWQGALSKEGYGNFAFPKAWDGLWYERAHRFAYSLANPDDDMDAFVCHSCDNPPCCNPGHLWLGSIQENNADSHRKGGSVSGRDLWPNPDVCPAQRVTREQVDFVKASYVSGRGSATNGFRLAEATGLSRTTIYRVLAAA